MSPYHRALPWIACPVIAAVLPGCCTLARLFCGPDRSEWVSESLDTAIHAVQTVREAIKRDRPDVVFRCLSEGFKARSGIRGSIEAEVAWERLREEFQGVHLLGYAEISDPEPLPDGRVRFVLTVSGRAFALTFLRQNYWTVQWDADDRDGRFVQTLAGYVRVEHHELDGTTAVRLVLPPVDAHDLTVDRLRSAAVGREWKLDELEQTEMPRRAAKDWAD